MTPAIPDGVELVLHIGGPKTGSSAIQRHCCTHAAALREAGLHYPAHSLDANGVSGGHGEIFALLRGGQQASARRALACHLSDSRRAGCRLVLSAEGVYPWAADVVPALPAQAFHIVCFLRHPLDAIASHHNQGIKRHFGTGPLSQAVDAIVSGAFVNPTLSGRVLLDWLRHCGRERMTVLPYVEEGEPVDAMGRFLGLFGLAAPALGASVNRSYTPAAAAFKRLVNALPETLLVGFDEALDRSLQGYSDARGVPQPMAADLLDPERLEALERHFRDDVELLEQTFGIRLEPRRRRPAAGVATDDTPSTVWGHVCRDESLAERVRAAVDMAVREELPVEGLGDLARLVALRR